jgi:hypothetical protein
MWLGAAEPTQKVTQEFHRIEISVENAATKTSDLNELGPAWLKAINERNACS